MFDDMIAALEQLKIAPSDQLVAYFVNEEGYINLRRVLESKSSIKPIAVDPNDNLYSPFSGAPVYKFPALAHSVCLFADGSTKPMMTTPPSVAQAAQPTDACPTAARQCGS